ncbi:hypothetical protein [Hymenobacter coccineus]|uniref:Uncharacterized protein n=1 Tax=Hymenobacter coccineus TaxID=1908235 RepID=A0A1G1TKH2_9BACT|nr:hypothetical protein [Hymenobacter coccineus]OGX91360.1 hypothetical protein BEN49_05035 [Hymenobacter coccineus]
MRFSWFAFALFSLAALLACGGITSHTYIKVGEQFVLGGWQRGTFRVKARNSGPVPVSVAERRTSGAVQERGRLEPGQDAALACGAGSALLMRNLGDRTAEIDAKITGDASFSMGMTQEALK